MDEQEPTSEKNQSEENKIQKFLSFAGLGIAGGITGSAPYYLYIFTLPNEYGGLLLAMVAIILGPMGAVIGLVVGLVVGYISKSKKGAFLSGLLISLILEFLFFRRLVSLGLWV